MLYSSGALATPLLLLLLRPLLLLALGLGVIPIVRMSHVVNVFVKFDHNLACMYVPTDRSRPRDRDRDRDREHPRRCRCCCWCCCQIPRRGKFKPLIGHCHHHGDEDIHIQEKGASTSSSVSRVTCLTTNTSSTSRANHGGDCGVGSRGGGGAGKRGKPTHARAEPVGACAACHAQKLPSERPFLYRELSRLSTGTHRRQTIHSGNDSQCYERVSPSHEHAARTLS